jgi:hypothetical protein
MIERKLLYCEVGGAFRDRRPRRSRLRPEEGLVRPMLLLIRGTWGNQTARHVFEDAFFRLVAFAPGLVVRQQCVAQIRASVSIEAQLHADPAVGGEGEVAGRVGLEVEAGGLDAAGVEQADGGEFVDVERVHLGVVAEGAREDVQRAARGNLEVGVRSQKGENGRVIEGFALS